jgi:hypothetical protein
MTGDGAKQGGNGYIDFLLQSANHHFEEKVQVSEVLSDNYVAFFFGHQAPIFRYQGMLMNTYQDDWTMRMFRIFRDLGRGTQLARRGQIMSLRYDSMIVVGAMRNLAWSTSATMEMASPFSFDFLVKNVHIIYGNVAPPTRVPGRFSPAWYKLEDSSFGTESSASQTYLGGPPVTPAGAGPKTELDFNQGEVWTEPGSTSNLPPYVKMESGPDVYDNNLDVYPATRAPQS